VENENKNKRRKLSSETNQKKIIVQAESDEAAMDFVLALDADPGATIVNKPSSNQSVETIVALPSAASITSNNDGNQTPALNVASEEKIILCKESVQAIVALPSAASITSNIDGNQTPALNVASEEKINLSCKESVQAIVALPSVASITSNIDGNQTPKFGLYVQKDIKLILEDFRYYETFTGVDPTHRESQSSKYVHRKATCYKHKKCSNDFLLEWFINDSEAYLEYMTENELEYLQSMNDLNLCPISSIHETTEKHPDNNATDDNFIPKFPEPVLMAFNEKDTEIIMKLSEKYECSYAIQNIELGIHPHHRNNEITNELKTK
jgi:hypothetical protein